MHALMKSRLISFSLIVVICGLIALIVMLALQRGIEVTSTPPVILLDEDRTEAERIIHARINSLSPTPPKLGGRFQVTAVTWDARGRALVTFEDGESTLEATATVKTGTGRVMIEGFVMNE